MRRQNNEHIRGEWKSKRTTSEWALTAHFLNNTFLWCKWNKTLKMALRSKATPLSQRGNSAPAAKKTGCAGKRLWGGEHSKKHANLLQDLQRVNAMLLHQAADTPRWTRTRDQDERGEDHWRTTFENVDCGEVGWSAVETSRQHHHCTETQRERKKTIQMDQSALNWQSAQVHQVTRTNN